MSGTLGQVGIAVAIYFGVVCTLGLIATRRAVRSPEEYFLAGRGLGTLVLFMALFGTNCTSFVLVGIPGLAYRTGIGVFGLNAAIVALGVPLTFWAIGSPARRWARKLGALSPAELYSKRLGSRGVGALLFAFFTLYTIPYMVQGVKAASLVLSQATDGAIAPWLVGLGVMTIVLIYTSLGGMRATAWTNVFQGSLFLGFMVAALFLLAKDLGGFGAATGAVLAEDPDLLRVKPVGLFEPRKWASWGLVISATVIGFPHMLARLMAAADDRAMRSVCRLYPLALGLLWIPAVLIGVWGRGAFPDLENPDGIFQAMALEHLPEILGAFAFLAVIAAVMSTLDAQILTLASMLVRDVLEPLRGALTQTLEIRATRAFVLGLAAVVYLLSLVWGESVFDISKKAFEGYTTLVPTLFLGLRWARFNKQGAWASILAGNGVLLFSWIGPDLGWAGFLPVFWAFLAAIAAGILGALVGGPAAPRPEAVHAGA